MYWFIRGTIFLSRIVSPKSDFLQNLIVVSETARRNLSKDPIKVKVSVKVR